MHTEIGGENPLINPGFIRFGKLTHRKVATSIVTKFKVSGGT